MKLLIDGYNVMNVGNVAPSGELHERRRELVRLAQEYGRRKKGIQVFIFFDSKEEIFLNDPSNPFVRVIFTSNESADDAIVDWIERCRTAREIQVATDDNGLRERVKAQGAGVVSVSDLMKRFDHCETHSPHHAAFREKAHVRKSEAEKPPLDQKTREEINRSLPWH